MDFGNQVSSGSYVAQTDDDCGLHGFEEFEVENGGGLGNFEFGRLRFDIRNIDDVFKPQPKRNNIIKGLLGENEMAIFFGKYGHKKSFIGISLALHVAAGEPFIGLETTKAPILYINEDSDQLSFEERIKAGVKGHEFKKDIPFYHISTAQFNFFKNSGDIKELEEMIFSHQVKLVVIDTWAAVTAGANENSVEDVQPVINKFRDLIARTGTSIIFIHHMNKDGEIRGSTAISGGCDSIIRISSPDGDMKIDISSEKKRHSAPFHQKAEIQITSDIDGNLETYTISPPVGSKPTQKFTEEKREIIEYAKSHNNKFNMPEFMKSKSPQDDSKYQNAKNYLINKDFLRKNDEESTGNYVVYDLFT